MIEATQLEKMSVAERLQTMEQLWESLCREPHNLASPPWHAAILQDRKARAERGEAHFLTLDQLRARLRLSS